MRRMTTCPGNQYLQGARSRQARQAPGKQVLPGPGAGKPGARSRQPTSSRQARRRRKAYVQDQECFAKTRQTGFCFHKFSVHLAPPLKWSLRHACVSGAMPKNDPLSSSAKLCVGCRAGVGPDIPFSCVEIREDVPEDVTHVGEDFVWGVAQASFGGTCLCRSLGMVPRAVDLESDLQFLIFSWAISAHEEVLGRRACCLRRELWWRCVAECVRR